MQSSSHLSVLTNCLLVQKGYMRSHTLIIAWFDHNGPAREFFQRVYRGWVGGSVSKNGCDVEKILQAVDIRPTEIIYNLNISITRLYVQVLL